MRCAAYAVKGCRVTAVGNFETITFSEDPKRQPGFLIQATEVEFTMPKRAGEAVAALSTDEDKSAADRAAA